MKSLVKRLLNRRIVRYGLVGGIGLPINDLALFVFKYFLRNFQLIVNLSLTPYPKYSVTLLDRYHPGVIG